MISHEITVRVRYGEVDQMGFLYHANYVVFYDMGRNELIRSLGITTKELEEIDRVMIPVLNVNIKYISPANFDDILTLKTSLRNMPGVKITFHTEVYREGVLINEGEVTLAFMSSDTKRAVRPPQRLIDALKPYFSTI